MPIKTKLHRYSAQPLSNLPSLLPWTCVCVGQRTAVGIGLNLSSAGISLPFCFDYNQFFLPEVRGLV